MEINYVYEIDKAIKQRFKVAKQEDEKVCLETKKNLLKLVNNCKDTEKIKVIYKYRYAILNRDIANPDLYNIYDRLFRKILFTDESSVIFKEWNNIFTTIFGNMPVIYDNVGKKYISKIVNMLCNSKNENKIKCLMNLFVSLYHIDSNDIDFIDLILNEIDKHEESYILDSFVIIIRNIYKVIENDFLNKYKDFILYQFSESNGEKNSLYLTRLLEVFINNELTGKVLHLLSLFKLFSLSTNYELINSCYTLVNNKTFFKIDSNLQNECLMILKNVKENNDIKIKLITNIILNIILVTDNNKIQKYLLEKIKIINNNKTLDLILKLEPILTNYTKEEEYIRVIDNLEDKQYNLNKKLVINLENKE